MVNDEFVGLPPSFPITTSAASSENPLTSTTSPRYWPSPANPSTNQRSSSHRTRHITRRRPVQSGSEVQPSSPYSWQTSSRENPGLPQDPLPSIYFGREHRASQEIAPVSSLRETASPTPARTDAGSSRASQALLDAPVPHSSRTSIESLVDEHVATGRFPAEAYENFRVWSYRYQAEREARRQAEQPRANLDTDTTRPEPLAEEAMNVKMECKICFAQISNHALLPCGE